MLSLISHVVSQINQCGFKCIQCDFLGNCLQCDQGYILNSVNGFCQSNCSLKDEYLNQELGQCNPICGYGYYEQRDFYVCQKSQKCPSINEFGNNLKQITGSSLVGSELVVFCKTFNSTNSQYNFFLRVYDQDLNFKGEMQQLTDEVKSYYIDQENKYFITVSLQEINFWQIPTWQIIRKDYLSAYVQNTKYVNYLDNNYLILQDQSEQLFTLINITNALQQNTIFQQQQFNLPIQQGQIKMQKGINSVFFTVFSQLGFFSTSLSFNNTNQQIYQYCNNFTVSSSLTPINDSYLIFGDTLNNIVIWQNGICLSQNISAKSPILNYFVFFDNSNASFLYIVAQGNTQYYELTIQNNTSLLSLINTTSMNGTFSMQLASGTLYVRNNFSYSIYKYQNMSLVKIYQGNSSNPDNQQFENILIYNNQVYEFYMNSIFINQPDQQMAHSENQVATCKQVKKSQNINFYQPTTVDAINQVILDPNYDGQLVVAGNDGSIRVYELTSFEDLSYIHLFTQYHPTCNQQSIMQNCLQANNVTISDLGYYYVIYTNSNDQFVTIWKRNSLNLTYISDYRLDVNSLKMIQSYQLLQNALLIQNNNQLKVIDIQQNKILVNETYTGTQTLFYVTFDQLWGQYILIYLYSNQITVRSFTNTTAIYTKAYSSLFGASLYYQSFLKAQYFSQIKTLAFILYEYIVVYNFTIQSSISYKMTYTYPLHNFCYHPANGDQIFQEQTYKNLGIIQSFSIIYYYTITGFITPYCGVTNKNIFYYYHTPNTNKALNTVFVMVMPNFQTNHVISFYNTVKSMIVDEDKLILYIGFTDGQIYVCHIILNYFINLSQFSNVTQFFYSKLKEYFIIYQGSQVFIIDSKKFLVQKTLQLPNQNIFNLQFNENLEIIILFQNNTIIQWRFNSGQLDQYPIQHKTDITSCYINSNSSLLISISKDYQIYVWSIARVQKLQNIQYHAIDSISFNNQQTNSSFIFSVTQMLLLEAENYLISSNSYNKIYIHDLTSNTFFKMQIKTQVILSSFNYDENYKFLYIFLIQDYSYIEIYSFQQSMEVSKAFSYTKTILGSNYKTNLFAKYQYQWAFIYEQNSITQIDRQSLKVNFVINTINPLISDFLISLTLRYIIFWSNCYLGICSPKVPIYSLDTGQYINEVSFEQQTEYGMIIQIILDENTNSLVIFKDQYPKIIVIYDLFNQFTVGLYSHTTDIFSFPLNNSLLIEETATLIVYSGNTIISMQIEHNLAPQQAILSVLPNRVQKIFYNQNKDLFFFDSKSQSWIFDTSQNTIQNNLITNQVSYQFNIKYFYTIDGSLFVIYKDKIVQINSNFQTLQQQYQEIDKAIQLPNLILTTTYLGNILLYKTNNLTQVSQSIQLGTRVKQLMMLLQFQEVMILAYDNNIYRFNYISYNLIKWYSPTQDQVYKMYYDNVNKITFITMKSGIYYIFDGINIQLSVPPNPILNSLQINYYSSQIFQIAIEPLTGIFAVYTIPDNNLSKIDFYQYNFINNQQLQNITYLDFIPSFSRSPGLKIQFIANQIFIFSPYQLFIYSYNLTQQIMIRSTSIFSSLKKIITINSLQNDTSLFFAQQENSISLLSYKNNILTQLYSHKCITPNLVDYQLNQFDGGFQVSILVVCDDKVINDSFYLENLTQSLSQIQQCYTVSETQYQYQFLQMLQNLDKSFSEESSNPAQIRIEQLQQTDFGSYNTSRSIQFVYRNLYINQQSTISLKESSFLNYQFQGLLIQNFLLDMREVTGRILFSQLIQEIVFNNVTFLLSEANVNMSNSKQQFYFENLVKVTLSGLSLNNFVLQRDAPLFVFSNINEILIDNMNIDAIKIQNLEIKQITINTFNQSQLINLEQINNFSILNSTFRKIISNSPLPIVNIYGSKNTILLNLIIQNCEQTSFLISQNFYFIQESQVLVQQNEISIFNVSALYMNSLGQSVFYLNQTSSVNIQSSQFQFIQCINCNGGALQINQGQNHIIQNCDFQQIQSQNGGALAIFECPTSNITITKSIFKQNIARIYGGAIYLSNSNAQITNTIIQQNNAQIGGGIKYANIKPILDQNLALRNLKYNKNNMTLDNFYRQAQQQQTGNIILDNIAKIYGNNIGSYIQDVIIFQPALISLNNRSEQLISNFQGINEQFLLQSYEINNFRSGDSIDLKIQLLDEENNPIKFNPNLVNKKKYDDEIMSELQNIQIKIEPQNNNELKVFGKYTADYSQFEEASSSFIIKGLIIVSNPSTSNIIQISSDSLIKIDAKTRQIDLESSNNLFSLVLINTRDCTYGEVYQPVDVIYQCSICQEGSYFLSIPNIDNTTCLKCPLNSQSCHKNEIKLKNGYWRLNNLTDSIISCSRNPGNCVPNQEKNYCIQGYYGTLCEQCDVYGILWDQPYISDGNYNCYPCADLIHKPYYSYLSLNLILMLLFIIASIFLQLSLTKSLTMSYYLRKMHLISIVKSAFYNSSSLGLKLFIGYLQVSGTIYSQLEFSFPYGTRLLSNTIGMPVTNLFYSLDCIFHKFTHFPILYLRVLWSLVIPLGYLISLSLILIIYGLYKQRSIKVLMINGAIFLFYFTQNSIVFLLFNMMSCRQIDGQYYISSDISYECYTKDHLNFMKYIGIPGILGWVFLIPLYIIKVVYRKKQQLEQISFRQNFGFIYNEFKPQFYYWDFIKSYKRLLITCILIFYVNPLDDKLILGFVIQLIYLSLLTKNKPFFSMQLYRIELFIETMLTVLFFISVVMNQDYSKNILHYLPKLQKYMKVSKLNVKHLTIWRKVRKQLLGQSIIQYIHQQMDSNSRIFFMNSSQKTVENVQNYANLSSPSKLNQEQCSSKIDQYKEANFQKQFPNTKQFKFLLQSENSFNLEKDLSKSKQEKSLLTLNSHQQKQAKQIKKFNFKMRETNKMNREIYDLDLQQQSGIRNTSNGFKLEMPNTNLIQLDTQIPLNSVESRLLSRSPRENSIMSKLLSQNISRYELNVKQNDEKFEDNKILQQPESKMNLQYQVCQQVKQINNCQINQKEKIKSIQVPKNQFDDIDVLD
ncbi:hypothetical protein ABPG74_017025 [Tetrahymena malaccensis]